MGLPTFGPCVYSVRAAQNLVLPVAPGADSPFVSADLPFLFPVAKFVTSILVVPRSGGALAPAAIAGQLALGIVDETNNPIVFDGRGTLQGTTLAPVAADCLALSGLQFRRFPMQRPVAAGDQWIFSLQNRDTVNAITVAGIFIYFEDP